MTDSDFFFNTNLPIPTALSQKDQRYIAKIGEHRIISQSEWQSLARMIRKEILDTHKSNPGLFADPDFIRKFFNIFFKREKILITNLKRVWNPYDWPHTPQKNTKGEYIEGAPIEFKNFSRRLSKGSYYGEQYKDYRFILVLDNPKELRNLKLRRKRQERRDRGIIRFCDECNKEFLAHHRDTVYCSSACKMRAYRKKKKNSSMVSSAVSPA